MWLILLEKKKKKEVKIICCIEKFNFLACVGEKKIFFLKSTFPEQSRSIWHNYILQ